MFIIKKVIKGFTLVEVLVTIGILGLIVGLAIPFYQSFQISSELDNSTQQVVQILRLAQLRAMSSQGLSAYGVHFDTNKFVLFKGDVYNDGDAENEEYETANTVDIASSGGSNVVFSSGYGLPDAQPVITLSASNNESQNISINNLGVVNVY